MGRDALDENNQDPERSSPSDAFKIKEDAKGQYAKPRADGGSTGAVSAKPTVVTESEDVTGHRTPPGARGPEKDWEVNFDENQPDRSR